MIRTVKKAVPLLPLAAATVMMLLVPTGCNPIGCFDAARSNGTCPPPNEAAKFFGDPECGGLVASVDSEATLRVDEKTGGNLCCYSITDKDPEYEGCPDF